MIDIFVFAMMMALLFSMGFITFALIASLCYR